MKSIKLNDTVVVLIPDDWNKVDDGRAITFYQQKDGVGALQMTIYTISPQEQIDLVEMLFDLLDYKFETLGIKLIDNHASTEVIDDDIHWWHWLLKTEDYIIYVTYNCEVADIGIEKEIVDDIIKSIA